MATDQGDVESQQEAPVEDAQEQNQDADEGTYEPPPEPDYPEDAVGFDGTPVDKILEERAERLDPENRPENTEVSNAGRELDIEKGMFKDEPGYEEAEPKFDPDAGA